jgi:activating signal cointegrator 1
MKALTLHQPWASYIACGSKRCETRSWSTNYRGPIAIHAALRPIDTRDRELIEWLPLPAGWTFCSGAIVATARLVDVLKIAMPTSDDFERRLGNWTPGRYAWVLLDVVPLRPPVPARGARGLWDWEPKP